MNISVSGLADFELAKYIPTDIIEGYKNTAHKTVMQLLQEGPATFLFEGVYKKSNEAYFEDGRFQKSMKTWLQDHERFKKETALTISANTYSDGKVSRKRTILTIGNYMAEVENSNQIFL